MNDDLNTELRAAKIAGDIIDSWKDVIRRHQVRIGEFHIDPLTPTFVGAWAHLKDTSVP